jgi:hypothetical protein
LAGGWSPSYRAARIEEYVASITERNGLFFEDRLAREKDKAAGERYEAVPFQLRELQNTLKQDAGLTIDIVRGWFAPGDHLFH